MNNINTFNNDYEIFRTYYRALIVLQDALNRDFSNLSNYEKSLSTTKKLTKLRELFNDAITLCGETMFEDIRLMIDELRHMKEDFIA